MNREMEIVKRPENYAGAFLREIEYTVTGINPAAWYQVVVSGSADGRTITRKYTGSDSYTINLSRYVRGQFDVSPLTGGTNSLTLCTQRLATLKVSSALVSDSVMFTAGWRSAGMPALLTASLCKLEIGRLESEEFSILLPKCRLRIVAQAADGESGSMVFYDNTLQQEGLYAFNLDMGSVADTLGNGMGSEFDLMFQADEAVFARKRCAITGRENGSVRVCWQNSYGGIDHYTFPQCSFRTRSVDKTRIFTGEGITVASGGMQQQYNLETGLVREEILEWLGEILCSPRVWMIEDGEYVRMDVMTDELTFKFAVPGNMKLRLQRRHKMNIPYDL